MNTTRRKKDGLTTKIAEKHQDDQQGRVALLAEGCISTAFFQSLLESLPYATAILDTEQHFLFFNTAFQELMQRLLGKQLTPGTSLHNFYGHVPVIQQRALILFNKAKHGDTCTITDTLILDQTLSKDYEIISSPMLDGQGQIVGATVLFREENEKLVAKITAPVLRETLERMVSERTTELEENNRMLQQEIAERKRVEEALKQSEHYFRLLAEMVPQAIWVMNQGGGANFSNKRALERFGELKQLTTTWRQIVHPDDWPALIAFREQRQEKMVTLEIETRIQDKNTDSYRWHQLYVSPVWNEKERAEEWIVTVTDIHDLKRAEEESRQNEEKLRWLTDAMPHLVWETSVDGANIEYANQRWINYRGISQVPGPTPPSERFAHSDDIEKIAERWQNVMKTGESFEGEFRIQRTVDGMYRWHLVRSLPIKNSEGKITSWLGTATDIHDSKEAQESLKQSEQNFRSLAEALPQIVWTAQPDGWLDYYNQKWFDYTGLTLEQTQGWGWEPVLHPEDLQNCINIWTHSFQTGEPYQIEYRFKRATDGMYRWHLGRALPMRDQQGQIIKWFGTGTDIHDWKSAQEQLAHLLQNEQTLRAETEATNERLEQMNRVQSDFISIVSHEFRTTLTGIQGFSELLCGEEFSTEEVRDYAGDIYSDAKRLTRMINDLLDLERMKSGKMSLKPEAVDINAILQEVVDRARPSISQHTMTLALDRRVPIFWGDADKLIQVMTNLSSNALKYSPNGGEILLTSRREKNTVHISVQDQGMGIPANALEEVFSPYSRIDVQRTRYIKGTGLGLAIVRQIIDMHEGNVWVESELGKGSTFHVVLPLKTPETKMETEKVQN